jgi:hypothetical protein
MRAAGVVAIALCAALPAHAADDSFATPEAAVAAFWRSLSNDPGKAADVATLTRLFHADGVVIGARLVDGKPALRTQPATTFLQSQSKAGEKGFYECEVFRSLHRYERFATVYSVVESRTRREDARPDFTGVNSLQLWRADDGWKIVSLYYHVETTSVPVPLEGGVSGRCL